jgi:hypothetical protein
VGVVSVVMGLACGFLGTMELLGIQRHLIADRWQFFVREEGVADHQQAFAIAERLAGDAQGRGWLLLGAGVLLLVNTGLLLGWTPVRHTESSVP